MNAAQRRATREIPEGEHPGALVSNRPDGSVIWTDSQGGYYCIDTDGTITQVGRPKTMQEIQEESRGQ